MGYRSTKFCWPLGFASFFGLLDVICRIPFRGALGGVWNCARSAVFRTADLFGLGSGGHFGEEESTEGSVGDVCGAKFEPLLI